MNIQLVRLNSGEESLCNLEKVDTDYFLKKPLILIPGEEAGQIGFMTWLPYAKTDDGVKVSNDFVAFIIEPDNQLAGEYTSHTSNVIVPNNNIFIQHCYYEWAFKHNIPNIVCVRYW